MQKEAIEELKESYKEARLLTVDCALASVDLNSLVHLRPLIWHVFNSLRVCPLPITLLPSLPTYNTPNGLSTALG